MLTQMDVYKMDGIKDLPMRVRTLFGRAWFAEYNGNNDEAAKLLDEAVVKEAEVAAENTAKK